MKMILTLLTVIFALYFSTLICIFTDLLAGIRQAKANGVFRSSYGYRKTVRKIGEYYNMLLVLTVIDAVQILIVYLLNNQLTWTLPLVPILTACGAIFIAFVELKSIREKNDNKTQARMNEAAASFVKILKDPNNREVAMSIIEYLKTDKEKSEP